MAYLIFTTAKGRELGRKSLNGSVVIGRSPSCEICIHDILLSRRHCQLEPNGKQWDLIDLASKNGTYLNGSEIGRHALTDGESFNIGKTVMIFHAGVLATARGGKAMDKPNPARPRPADPFEALTATVSGFDYVKSLAQRNERLGAKPRISIPPQAPAEAHGEARRSVPTPQPIPPDPKAYQADDVYSLLNELVSSSWDSIYMNASRPAPTRPAPRPIVLSSRHPRHRGSAGVDMSLQVTSFAPPRKPAQPPAAGPRHWQRALLGAARGLAAIGQSVLVLGIVHLLAK